MAGFTGVGTKSIHSDDTINGLQPLAHLDLPRLLVVSIGEAHLMHIAALFMVGRQQFARRGLTLFIMYFYFPATNAVTNIRLGGYTQMWIGICCKQCTDNMFRHDSFTF